MAQVYDTFPQYAGMAPVYSMLTSVPVLVVIDPVGISELEDGISKIIKHAPHKNVVYNNDMVDNGAAFKWHLRFIHDADLKARQVSVSTSHQQYKDVAEGQRFEIYVCYQRRIEAFRALGRIMSAAMDESIYTGDHGHLISYVEEAKFETQGVMVDCSRNGVMRPESVYLLLCNMALMGLNMLQLYTEDTFEIEGEPMFGYLRGRYTQQELSAIDDYAFDLGIEVIPCIQTLGHLGQILQWPHYAYLRDTSEVLLAESEATYEFIEKLIISAASPFRSRRIHIGMDECYGIGEQRYRQIFGYKEPTRIFVEHLQRVNDICTRLDLQPMIWSDMLFCLAAKNNTLNGYYDEANNPADAPELAEGMPSNVELIFWNYYYTTSDMYTRKLEQHRELGCRQPWVATAAWTWSRFWTALPFSFETIRASTVAAKSENGGVQNSFITIWGDEGNECDMFSALPALCYYADHGYTDQEEVNVYILKRNFAAICGGNFDDWFEASKIDDTPSGQHIGPRTRYAPNISKWLLWEDPFLSFLTPQYAEENMEAHYEAIASHLFSALENNQGFYPFNARLELPARLAKVLSLKCHLRRALVSAYRHRDYDQLLHLANDRLQRLREQVDGLWKYHRHLWMTMYKPFGWEVLELRYGGLRTRLETMQEHILRHIETVHRLRSQSLALTNDNGKPLPDQEEDLDLQDRVYCSIPEFEEDLECLYIGSKSNLLLDYSRVTTPSRIG